MKKLPIGIQDFRKLREGGFLYIDKTEYLYKLSQAAGYFFLVRPRRFGKSLLVSTLRELFSGSRELFEGLWIENKYDWEKVHPVIHISFSSLGYKDLGLEEALSQKIDESAAYYEVVLTKEGIAKRFEELLHLLGQKKPVVLLIDEYDKPTIDYIDDLDTVKQNRKTLCNFKTSGFPPAPLLS